MSYLAVTYLPTSCDALVEKRVAHSTTCTPLNSKSRSPGAASLHTRFCRWTQLNAPESVTRVSFCCVGYMLRFEYEHACLHISSEPVDTPGWRQTPRYPLLSTQPFAHIKLLSIRVQESVPYHTGDKASHPLGPIFQGNFLNNVKSVNAYQVHTYVRPWNYSSTAVSRGDISKATILGLLCPPSWHVLEQTGSCIRLREYIYSVRTRAYSRDVTASLSLCIHLQGHVVMSYVISGRASVI